MDRRATCLSIVSLSSSMNKQSMKKGKCLSRLACLESPPPRIPACTFFFGLGTSGCLTTDPPGCGRSGLSRWSRCPHEWRRRVFCRSRLMLGYMSSNGRAFELAPSSSPLPHHPLLCAESKTVSTLKVMTTRQIPSHEVDRGSNN